MVFATLIGWMAMLFGRAIDLQVLDRKDFLQHQGELRYVAIMPMPAHRGRILDRNSDPLAISTPVQSVWINPQQFKINRADFARLAEILEIPASQLGAKIRQAAGRRFVYLKRRVDPSQVTAVKRLNVDGLDFEDEYRRYYPAGEVTSHLIGFSNIDDRGQEGLELAYDDYLKGIPGSKRVIRDGKSRVIEDIEKINTPIPGNDLVLTIDQKLQYLAYRELAFAVKKHRARSGNLVLLDAKNGEVLAIVNQPSFNPNIRKNLSAARYRNRAVTDVFEPGSTTKPFVVSCALEAGNYRPDSPIDTTPGVIRVGRNVVHDLHNYGLIDVARVLQKSSNVGITKIGLSLSPTQLWNCYDAFGIAKAPGTGFPAEAVGMLPDPSGWNKFEQATMSFGYGLSISTLQLARAYSVLGNNGVLKPVSLVKEGTGNFDRRVTSSTTAHTVINMLEKVVSADGTAWNAKVPGYRVAGKTGTVKKSALGGYSETDYMAIFAGMAPVADPRLIMVVVIDVPSAGEYYGGKVAAPVFSKFMGTALRLLGIPPERQNGIPIIIANHGDIA